jgi:hypothetical protein
MVALTQFCEGCAIRKHRKASYKLNITKERSQIIGLFLWGHLWPMQKDSFGGACYYFLFKDDCLGYKFVYCIKNKFEVLSCFKHLVV